MHAIIFTENDLPTDENINGCFGLEGTLSSSGDNTTRQGRYLFSPFKHPANNHKLELRLTV